ncbi:hypothetical protein QAD02_003495 [Eretmocerus hayati]|uniref:Uncharacterized protein n=1 Tax=Eretmocerus hayati TaxID=131215 RepID=A0ACC2NNP5_9HYME|nr:hypothetical protein QAD02_003495 [Eretmocerus hayati]
MNQNHPKWPGIPSFSLVTVTNHPGPGATRLGGGPRGRGPSKSLGAPSLGPAATRFGGCPRWVCGDGHTPTRACVHTDWWGLEGLWAVLGTVRRTILATVTYLQARIHTVRWGLERSRAVRGTVRRTILATVTYLQARIHTVRWGLERSRAVLGTVRRTFVATVTYLQARIHTIRWGLERSRAVRDIVRRIDLVDCLVSVLWFVLVCVV